MKLLSQRFKRGGLFVAGLLVVLSSAALTPAAVSAAEESGSIGLEGRISAPPPTQPPTISVPNNNSTVDDPAVTISGLCQDGLLVKIFNNNIFVGSVMCVNGSYSIQVTLFPGRNEIVARQFDDLDQASPDSNTVVINYAVPGGTVLNCPLLTSSFAKRGANPGARLEWPISVSGGESPYAITVDWGDGKTADVISQPFPGTFNIGHIYDSPGAYNVTIRAADKTCDLAFLQLVGIGNGTGQDSGSTTEQEGSVITKTKILWQPAAIAVPLIASSFWLGKRYELYILRKRLEDGS